MKDQYLTIKNKEARVTHHIPFDVITDALKYLGLKELSTLLKVNKNFSDTTIKFVNKILPIFYDDEYKHFKHFKYNYMPTIDFLPTIIKENKKMLEELTKKGEHLNHLEASEKSLLLMLPTSANSLGFKAFVTFIKTLEYISNTKNPIPEGYSINDITELLKEDVTDTLTMFKSTPESKTNRAPEIIINNFISSQEKLIAKILKDIENGRLSFTDISEISTEAKLFFDKFFKIIDEDFETKLENQLDTLILEEHGTNNKLKALSKKDNPSKKNEIMKLKESLDELNISREMLIEEKKLMELYERSKFPINLLKEIQNNPPSRQKPKM